MRRRHEPESERCVDLSLCVELDVGLEVLVVQVHGPLPRTLTVRQPAPLDQVPHTLATVKASEFHT